MLQIVYHPQVQEMLKSFHPTVGDSLAKLVLDFRAAKGASPEVVTHPTDDVAPESRVFHLPLFRGSVLVAFYTEYQGYPVVFSLLQKDAGSTEFSADEAAGAQNLLYDCQVNIDRTIPKLTD